MMKNAVQVQYVTDKRGSPKVEYDFREMALDIVGVHRVTGAVQECDRNLPGALESLVRMGQCIAPVLTSGMTAVWNLEGWWRSILDPQTKKRMELPDPEDYRHSKEGKKGVDPSQVLSRILRHACPCVPGTTVAAIVQAEMGAYNRIRKGVFQGESSLPCYSPPFSFRFRGDRLDVLVDGDTVYISVPIRTSKLCSWAEGELKTGRKPPCVERGWRNGAEPEVIRRSIRGADSRIAWVTFRCAANGSRQQELVSDLASGKARYRDLRIQRQGNGRGKTSWMARLSYRRGKAKPAEGANTAVILFSHMQAAFVLVSDGRMLVDLKSDPLRGKQAMFANIKGEATYLERLRQKKDEMRQRRRRAGWGVAYQPPGARGRGCTRRFRSTADAKRTEGRWMAQMAWEIANKVGPYCLGNGVGKVLLVKWSESENEDIPRNKRHLIFRFPRHLIANRIEQWFRRHGVETKTVAEPAAVCPLCGEKLSFGLGGMFRCACGFYSGSERLRAITVMIEQEVEGAGELFDKLKRAAEFARRAKEIDDKAQIAADLDEVAGGRRQG